MQNQNQRFTQEELQSFKKLLLDRRVELLQELENFKNGDAANTIKEASGENSSYAFHMADLGTDTMEREKAYYFATREGRLLFSIEQALERVETGSYGFCQNCSQPISRERLEAVPHAVLCITCKANEEKSPYSELV
ncbi:MAG: TraR/DksA C4-type zinc finger protein [candidate division KSB1 bacterium]|nr:TraR/DksA C4-type zinc finger protein [candidate division KSB1 bacterium]MDZ7303462.1 TraR/DksA C4-type zinc finger protein [candidate division KSB1 bacterium]MDZ7312544.1 TraR/DksA C4-type zinc finger protein [candidate division KSB1 bacterium]